MSGGPRALLAASLALNALLAAGLWHKSADTRAYWAARLAATPTPAASQAPAGAPPSDPGYMARELARTTPAHAYAGQAGGAFAAWRARVAADLVELLALPAPAGPAEVRIGPREELAKVVRERRWLRMADGLWLPAWLLMPRGATGRSPAVLALPGHDGPNADARGARAIAHVGGPDNYMGGFGVALAEAGHVVLALDVAGVGELAYLDYAALSHHGLLIGEPHLGRMVAQARVGLAHLRALPQVDPARVGTAGLSLGGELALFTAVVEPGAAFAATAGFFTSYRDVPAEAMASIFVPGILTRVDVPDVAGALAPRPLLVQVDPGDPINRPRALEAYRRTTAAAYAGAGAPDAFAFQAHGLGHRLDPAGLVRWLAAVTRR